MIYVITEDRNSGRDLWKIAFNTFYKSDDFCIVPFNKNQNGVAITGNTSLDGQVDTVLSIAKEGDILFVAFDNIGASVRVNNTERKRGFDSGDFINVTSIKCKRKSVKFYVTGYYCFEEIYLSYLGLLHLCEKDGNNIQLTQAVEYVRSCIEKGEDYYDKNNKNVKYVMSIKQDAGNNKEHFADALLFHATRSIRHGLFTISKKRDRCCILKCWSGSCEVLRETNKNLLENKHCCEQCKFDMKDKDTRNKLMDLGNKSIVKDSVVLCQDTDKPYKDIMGKDPDVLVKSASSF